MGTAYSDGITARNYTYNHLSQLTQVVDDAGTRTIGYNPYGERETDRLTANGVTHLITETRDAMVCFQTGEVPPVSERFQL